MRFVEVNYVSINLTALRGLWGKIYTLLGDEI